MFSTLKARTLINKIPAGEVEKFRLKMLSDRYAYYVLIDITHFHTDRNRKKSRLLKGYECDFFHSSVKLSASLTRKKDNVKIVGNLEEGKYLSYIEVGGEKVFNAKEKNEWINDLFDNKLTRIYLALNKVKKGFYQF